MQFHDRMWGPDVSSWQGTIDWEAVKRDGASFGISKVTEGIDYVNPTARSNWTQMFMAGLVRVQYHYARPAKYSATEEATWFLSRAMDVTEGDIIALDLETDSRDGSFDNGAYWADSWLRIVQEKVGFAPMLYCNGGILSDRRQGFDQFPDMAKRNGLWLASWQDVLPLPVFPWEVVALWQFTNSAQVAGIAGVVDCNIFNGTLDTMRKYGKPGRVPVPEVTKGPFDGWTLDQCKERLAGLVSAVGYMGGDLADRLEDKSATRYAIKDIAAELRRVKTEQLG